MTLRVGLFGCGRIAGFFHARILAGMEGVRLVALADVDPQARMRLAAAAPGATLYADWRRPLELGEIDAAVICLPPALHAPAAIAGFEAGAHVYVEKPLALSVEEADAMIAARDAADRVGMTGLNFRFHPAALEMRRRLQAGEIGTLQAVQGMFTSARRAMPAWKSAEGGGGGAIEDLATHMFDLIPQLAGAPIVPESLGGARVGGADGSLAVLAGRLASGVPVGLTVGQTTGLSTNRVELMGETGHLVLDIAGGGTLRLARPAAGSPRVARLREAAAELSPRILLAPTLDPSFAAALTRFRDAALGRAEADPGFEDGRRAMQLALRATAATTAAEAEEIHA